MVNYHFIVPPVWHAIFDGTKSIDDIFSGMQPLAAFCG